MPPLFFFLTFWIK